jgi:anti-sigma regulatory factor (Ser/Thr protein kinase)
MAIERTDGGLDLRLAPTARAPAEARAAVERRLHGLHPEERRTVQLLVSELITNSVRHAGLEAGGWIDLEVEVDPDAVRVTVTDPGEGFEVPHRAPQPGDPYGWGLFLVRRVANRWGVSSDGHTRVWFEVGRRTAATG